MQATPSSSTWARISESGRGGGQHTRTHPYRSLLRVKTKFDFHLLPSGLINERCAGFIGSGVVVHVPSFFAELDAITKKGERGAARRSQDCR